MRLASPETYVTAAAMCVLLFLIAPPAGCVMAVLVLVNAIDEHTSTPPPECWKADTETGLETLGSCSCRMQMGDDFYYLIPKGECLHDRCKHR